MLRGLKRWKVYVFSSAAKVRSISVFFWIRFMSSRRFALFGRLFHFFLAFSFLVADAMASPHLSMVFKIGYAKLIFLPFHPAFVKGLIRFSQIILYEACPSSAVAC